MPPKKQKMAPLFKKYNFQKALKEHSKYGRGYFRLSNPEKNTSALFWESESKMLTPIRDILKAPVDMTVEELRVELQGLRWLKCPIQNSTETESFLERQLRKFSRLDLIHVKDAYIDEPWTPISPDYSITNGDGYDIVTVDNQLIPQHNPIILERGCWANGLPIWVAK
jgi:hypothetical protein